MKRRKTPGHSNLLYATRTMKQRKTTMRVAQRMMKMRRSNRRTMRVAMRMTRVMMKMRVMMKTRRAMMKTRVMMKTRTVRSRAKTARSRAKTVGSRAKTVGSRAKTVGSRIVQTVMLWTQLMTDSVPLPCPSTPFYHFYMYFYCITRIHAQPGLFKHIYNPCSLKGSRDRYMALF